jgi:sugar (pentulose or hexulose) kinase
VGIVMCVQMHSLVLVTADGKPVSNVVSWQDERALKVEAGDGSSSLRNSIDWSRRTSGGNSAMSRAPACR